MTGPGYRGESPAQRDVEQAASPPTRRRRHRFAFRLVAILLSLLPFVVVEFALRQIDEPVSEAVDDDPLVNLENLQPLFVLEPKQTPGGSNAGRWVIPETRMNFFRPASFSQEKVPGAKRVFVLGASTVQGRPYATETAFSKWLELRLQAAAPTTPIEVVNCGGVSYASYRVDKILQEVLHHEPDLIVLYTGHNEFLEARSYAPTREITPLRRTLARLGSKLHTVRYLRRLISGRSTTASSKRSTLSAEVDARLDHLDGLQQYRRDPEWQRDVEAHFAETLQRMITRCRAAEVPMVICVPASDLVNTPPFKNEPAPWLGESARRRFDAAWALATSSDPGVQASDRAKACQLCLEIDPQHAGANYLWGRWAYQEGDALRASRYLTLARDHDVCPLRATSAIENATRTAIAASNLAHVDVPALLDQRNAAGIAVPDAIADPEAFVDHVHPSIAAHEKIGAAIARELERQGWPPSDRQAQQRYRDAAAAHLATLSEVYYGRGKQRLEGLRNWAAGRAAAVGEPLRSPNAVPR